MQRLLLDKVEKGRIPETGQGFWLLLIKKSLLRPPEFRKDGFSLEELLVCSGARERQLKSWVWLILQRAGGKGR